MKKYKFKDGKIEVECTSVEVFEPSQVLADIEVLISIQQKIIDDAQVILTELQADKTEVENLIN